jgi:outer membrane protein assembly factor BamD (BamD/ComL family)
MRTDKPEKTNPLLAASLATIEARITKLYAERSENEDAVENRKRQIVRLNAEIEEAEEAKKFVKRAIVDSNEAARYLGSDS